MQRKINFPLLDYLIKDLDRTWKIKMEGRGWKKGDYVEIGKKKWHILSLSSWENYLYSRETMRKQRKIGQTTFLENIVREVPNQIHHPFQFLIYCMWYHQLCYTDSSIFISPLCWSSILRHGYVQFDTPFGPKSRITYN